MYRTKTEIRLILMRTPGPEGKFTRGSASFRNKRRAMGPNEYFVLYIGLIIEIHILRLRISIGSEILGQNKFGEASIILS